MQAFFVLVFCKYIYIYIYIYIENFIFKELEKKIICIDVDHNFRLL
ncbi:hypothetical protein ACMBCM_06960 [Spiroplasma sp. K1]